MRVLRHSFAIALACTCSSVVACLDNPTFVLDEGTPPTTGAAATTAGAHDGMIAIPQTTLPGSAPVAPQDDGPGKGNGNGKGGGGPGNGNGKGPPDAGAGDANPSAGLAPAPPGPAASAAIATVVPAFWLDALEVSVAAYEACKLAGACSAPSTDEGCTEPAALSTHPINCVTFEQAALFCTWRGVRLPTNDEWTAATAGATSRPYPWGAASPTADLLDACGGECSPLGMYLASDGYPMTAPRGSFPLGKSPEGVADLAGNVAEWVDATVVRGGSFADTAAATVSSHATRTVAAGTVSPTIGFRCASE